MKSDNILMILTMTAKRHVGTQKVFSFFYSFKNFLILLIKIYVSRANFGQVDRKRTIII